MFKRPYILISNDDGVRAPGIKHLANALKDYAEIIVVAPANEQSAVGQSITIRQPLQIKQLDDTGIEAPVWSVNGTPTDSVKIALSVILKRKPDLIVSGINRGSNAGRNVLYSGTIAATVEGVLQDIPGIAFSMVDFFDPEYELAEKHIPSIIHYLEKHPLPKGAFLNVNFPTNMKERFKGIRFAKQGREYWMDNPEEREHPAERSIYYWLGTKLASFEEDIQSDIACLKEGYASVVPINISDLTHHDHFNEKHHHFTAFLEEYGRQNFNSF